MIDSFRGSYQWLSNFHERPVVYEGTKYPTAEHAYQASKALTIRDKETVLKAGTPGKAKRLGRSIRTRKDWDAIKDDVMLAIIRAKFENQELAARLCATWPHELIEGNTWGDTYWGVSMPSGKGQNRLGKILMQVRDEKMFNHG